MSENIIEVKDLWVSYPEHTEKPLKKLISVHKKEDRFWALKGLNFEVKKGEVLGVIGRNGSGKSTLLKLLSGLISPDKGEFSIMDEEHPVLLSLGAGFQPELPGIENIYLNGLLLGHKKKTIDEKIDDIIEFSELGDFIYKPVRTYSAGMKSRLAFATAISLDPEILLIDEVLGVGDTAFQMKCREAIMEKIKQERTVILVTHSSNLVRAICDRVVWIHLGEQKAVGETGPIVKEYDEFMKKAR
ncbi:MULTISPECIES: ABC transporter ATP-binding protein [Metabacillus]|uniref:ABC transporter ATP-binding protein n=1 Tax=Metabacillus hrfriensis TaxID=3048891 RepID=A0ACD4RBI6_9BACI|nr:MULTISPECIES: ABC transporter ATP-binding protein [Metabacillus]UAL52022.1 ABC transporter ATP-binding protein [Metabacillus dongyingensis]UOK57810.1 ABC transporter ATP-binding protein [Bacillus sp. OVS6]USK28337.1 ABC transporter ATP-binding protein [Bacillus sp. CMF21]WHZ57535.1 ABC transporter ATP-binding protein [Metabacillus sp. CT-WN-B3]